MQVFVYKVVVNDEEKESFFSYSDERIAQLMRLMQSYFLDKRKETSRRLLMMTPSAITTLAPNLRLVIHNSSAESMMDIYSQVSTLST